MKERILVGKEIVPFLTTNILPNNYFVSIGYMHDGALNYGPKTRKKVNQENDRILRGYLSGSELENSPRFRQCLQSFVDSEKYSLVLSGERNTAPMDIEGDVHIIKVSRTVVRWMQNRTFLSTFGDWQREETSIRTKHGFGKDESEYGPNDWRRKEEYKGLDSYRAREEKRLHNKKYTQSVGQSGLFRDPNEPDRMAFRLFIDLSLADRPEWYFIDEDGTAEKLNNKVLRFLNNEYTQRRVSNVMKEIAKDEKEFLDDLQIFLNKIKPQNDFVLENILYMTGTAITPDGEKQPFTWVNTTYLYQKYPWLDKEFINSVVENHVAFSKEDIDKLFESYMRENHLHGKLILLEAIERGIRQALNESNGCRTDEECLRANLVCLYDHCDQQNFYILKNPTVEDIKEIGEYHNRYYYKEKNPNPKDRIVAEFLEWAYYNIKLDGLTCIEYDDENVNLCSFDFNDDKELYKFVYKAYSKDEAPLKSDASGRRDFSEEARIDYVLNVISQNILNLRDHYGFGIGVRLSFIEYFFKDYKEILDRYNNGDKEGDPDWLKRIKEKEKILSSYLSFASYMKSQVKNSFCNCDSGSATILLNLKTELIFELGKAKIHFIKSFKLYKEEMYKILTKEHKIKESQEFDFNSNINE